MTTNPEHDNTSEKPVTPDNSWFGSMSQLIGSDEGTLSAKERLAEKCVRATMMIKVRWIMLAMLFVYVMLAELLLAPDIDLPIFHIEQWSFSLKAAAVFFAVAYPAVSIPCCFWRSKQLLIYLQVLLDLLFVTAAIHWSGGVISWFWPAYLLVSLESAFLFEKKREVWGIGAIGAALYGMLLVIEQLDFIPSVRMPFMEEETPSILFEFLMWCWVAGLNAVVSFFGAFLMDKIRSDHKKVRQSEEALTGFIETARDLIFCCRDNGLLLYLNRSGHTILGTNGELATGSNLLDFADNESRTVFLCQIAKLQQTDDAGSCEIRLVSRATGETTELEASLSLCGGNSSDTVIWGVCHNITERNLAQRELVRQAHHDVLTGLPNRILLYDRLHQAKAIAHRLNTGFALLFIDMDRFKIVNDTLGHAVGDDLLRMIAHRLKICFRESDTIARIGGDEFVVLMLNVTDRGDITAMSDKLLHEFVQPFVIGNHELFVSVSGGVCLYPEDEADTEIMMQKADIAMYHAKALGRNNVQFYSSTMDQNASRRLAIANSMRRGLDRGEFRLYYQPKLDVSSGCIVSTEALVRWQHPELGLLSPVEFIQLAEENGLIVELGEWVLREACRQNMLWQQSGMKNLRVAVNLSGYQLQHSRFVETVKSILDETGLPGEHLEFEITESVIMQNPDYAVLVLNEISSLGINISIDDFGTGYSSLAHLKRFSVNTLKIDKSFVREVESNVTDAAIATAIIAMGNSLNLKVIAEGVETVQQMDFLRDNNCDQVQGFLISRPLPAEEALRVLREKCIGELGQSAAAL